MRASHETLVLLAILANEAPYAGDNASLLALHAKLARERRGPPLVYIAGPFSASTRSEIDRNIGRAEGVGLVVARAGAMPVIPHSNTGAPGFETAKPYGFWLDGTMAMLYRCDAVVMVDGWEASKGATGERREAKRIGMPVFDNAGPDFCEWLEQWKA